MCRFLACRLFLCAIYGCYDTMQVACMTLNRRAEPAPFSSALEFVECIAARRQQSIIYISVETGVKLGRSQLELRLPSSRSHPVRTSKLFCHEREIRSQSQVSFIHISRKKTSKGLYNLYNVTLSLVSQQLTCPNLLPPYPTHSRIHWKVKFPVHSLIHWASYCRSNLL